MSEKEVIKMSEEDRRKRAEMDLLLDDNTDVKAVKFDKKVAKSDARFQVEGDNEFAVDPTHKDYRKVVQGHNKVSKRARRSWVWSLVQIHLTFLIKKVTKDWISS